MKKLTQIMAVAFLALATNLSQAAEKKIVGGPKGGRLLDNEPPRAEFFVEKDRKVTITFYDKDLKPVAAGEQVVNVVAEPKSGKTKLEMEKKGDVLVSKTALPEGDDYNVVVQVKSTPDAKPKNFRIPLATSECGGCKRAEYACICDH